jgi:hypothetical protein
MPDWLSDLTLIVALLLSLFNLWDKIDYRIKTAREPTKMLEERIEVLEKLLNTDYEPRFTQYDEHFKADLQRIEQIEEGNKVTQKALLALLNHAIDGNNTAQLKKAEEDLTQYLINR